jgi:methyltransferase
MHPDLANVGLMNPIEAKHHLKADQPSQFREGVALERPTKHGAGSWVDIGLKQQARMDLLVLPLTRVTLRIKNFEDPQAPYYEAEAISKKTPRLEDGQYWGYDVRIAQNLTEMVEGGEYDHVLLCNHSTESYGLPQIENFTSVPLQEKSILIYFAGTEDLGTFIEKDVRAKWTLEEALKRFSYALKQCSLGVKQLRLEEQLFLTLSKLVEYTL